MLTGWKTIAERIFLQVKRLPDEPRRYGIAILAMVGVTCLAAILLHTVGPKASLVFGLLGTLLVLAAAWLGYGQGVLVCTITTFFVPRILLPSPAPPVNLGRFGLLIVVSLLVSCLSAAKRRTERSLRRFAEELEDRVRERTLELQNNEQRLREQAQLLDLAPVAILAADADSRIWAWSQGAAQMYGFTAAEAIGQTSHELLQTSFPIPLTEMRERLKSVGIWEGELTQHKRDGSRIVVLSRWALRRNAGGETCGHLEIHNDITERKRVEEQLRHSQKLESVGLLAGGVAHDFNNLLTVINGYAEMSLDELPAGSPLEGSLSEIRAAGERAAGLTQQLLAFSRKQVIQLAVLNLNHVVTDLHKMLKRLIGENIEIVTHLESTLGNVMADAGQMQQVIMNLAVNARDAMPSGGTLVIETSNVVFDDSYCAAHPEVHVGPAILLAVTDTGTGMTEEVKQRLFEPFFTTKPAGVGTGLGLATVYGMVKQSGGWIWVYSELGQGTAFKIYIPRTDVRAALEKIDSPQTQCGAETVLLVEDQPEVRALARLALTRTGYHVLEADRGEEALAISAEFDGKIHLLLTDVIMPGMNGRDLADRMLTLREGIGVLFMSGYTENCVTQRGVLDAGVSYLQKPFTPKVLVERVAEVLWSNRRKDTIASDISTK